MYQVEGGIVFEKGDELKIVNCIIEYTHPAILDFIGIEITKE